MDALLILQESERGGLSTDKARFLGFFRRLIHSTVYLGAALLSTLPREPFRAMTDAPMRSATLSMVQRGLPYIEGPYVGSVAGFVPPKGPSRPGIR